MKLANAQKPEPAEEIGRPPIQKKESRSDTKSYSDSKKLFLEIYLEQICGMHNSCHVHICLELIMLEFPMSEQAPITLESGEMEEISGALISLNSLVNTGLPRIKKQV